ncbi:phosphoribosyl-AMP cyclohydrolase [Kushneria indalinina]|uniref:Phosphoribosyl-AMP cyclohydrolase n=1 Tax=Kushneria indalinina DSM 14324 TaxID=1122140 RepID=A0A3D9E103_9GAMM|nr:phosphoribosyl-AMP cyclohydrolase [Kushneria indalinina]REC96219.1 phosphoribosyl-AMP cyclohydrolase [Kushneria indalinina DSM 14324]
MSASSPTYKSLEQAAPGHEADLEALLAAAGWNDEGLMPAIAQQFDSGEVLMMAWMTRQTLEETLRTRRVCYWSRSRQKPWRKGESSGQVQMLNQAWLDCDGDTLLLKVDQTGPACHTGRRTCFYLALDETGAHVDTAPMMSAEALYGNS